MNTLADRLRLAMATRIPPCIQADLVKACGVKGSSVSNWFSGETKRLKAESAILAADYLRVRPRWLIDGTGPMRHFEPAAGVLDDTPHARSERGTYIAPPTLPAALPVVLDALEACPHTAELERLLPLLPTGVPAYRERFAELLGVEVAHAPAVAPTAPAVAPAPPLPDLARHRSQAGTHGFKPPPVPGGPVRTPSGAGPAESSAGSAPVPRPAE